MPARSKPSPSEPPARRIILLAFNVRSLWNVGSFFRTCDAFAVEKLWLTGYTGHPPRKEIAKTALGAEMTVPWEHALDPAPVVDALLANGWEIVSLELTPKAVPLTEYRPAAKTCLVVGHELEGVPLPILEKSAAVVQIPMLGSKESLNVSVAAGIALHYVRTAGG
jgi:23S rRNA (guanosine2251-2'-O)-methyltransferase